VTQLLGEIGLPFREEPRLVRGLDYYTRTVFEVISDTTPEVGTVLGGGRYDGLAEILDGPPTPAIGFAGGLERLILALRQEEEKPLEPDKADVFVAYIGNGTKEVAFSLTRQLRAAGHATILTLGGRGLKSQMKLANRTGAAFSVIVGEGELAEGKVQLRDMGRSDQEEIALVDIVGELTTRLRKTRA
jgi:histidyl-tRNA synthetase